MIFVDIMIHRLAKVKVNMCNGLERVFSLDTIIWTMDSFYSAP